jgi:hypothetical protein
MENLLKSSIGIQNWCRILESMRENRKKNEHYLEKSYVILGWKMIIYFFS